MAAMNMNSKSFEVEGSVKPNNVSSHLWEKFKSLEKRTNDVTKRSTEKRIKHLQRDVLDTVNQEFTNDEDKDILREHDVKFGPPVERLQERGKKKRKRKAGQNSGMSEDMPGPIDKLQTFMDINDHLVTTDHSRPPPPTALEQKMDSAICHGDLSTAEVLSDQLANRQAAERIVSAIDSKKFLEEKEKANETAKNKNKRKLPWGFEHKQRWEMKGNM